MLLYGCHKVLAGLEGSTGCKYTEAQLKKKSIKAISKNLFSVFGESKTQWKHVPFVFQQFV